jgi:hypothetical protein
VNIEPVIAALSDHYTPDEAAEFERVLRAYNGTIPDEQLISEAALALAIWRRGRFLSAVSGPPGAVTFL